jgi:hypothetical protein
MTIGLVKRPLTVEQFNRMIDARIFPQHDRLELMLTAERVVPGLPADAIVSSALSPPRPPSAP